MRIQLIRHGQTPNNVAGVLDTAEPGALLTKLGHDQAKSLPSRLRNVPLDTVYASTLTRTQLTAQPLVTARGMETNVREGLREVQAGTLEGGRERNIFEDYFASIISWFDGDLVRRMPGAENGYEVLERFDSVVEEAEKSGAESVALVSHGAMMVTWAGLRAAGLSTDFVLAHHPSNTGIVVLEGTLAQGYRALSWLGEPVTDR